MLPLQDLKPGDTLGRYEILAPVARGGMATVWAARQTGSRGFTKLVAIKTMLPGMTDDPDFEAMFLDEARLASKIRHPHVVEIIDLGDEDDWVYIVMEWVDGETMFTLNKRAKARGGFPLPLMLRIASSTCAGLHAAHELRDEKGHLLELVHRDVSPQNIMVSFNGIVKIVDFGVAKAKGRMHETRVAGIMKGKVPYLSPEQLTGQKVDRRSDLFALGILMYVMLSGRHPFRGETDAKTMENICTRAPVPLRDLVPTIRPDLEAIVMKALAKEREARWQTASDMQRALDQVQAALGVSVTDGDVAQFVKSLASDVLEERQRSLASAIEQLDARSGVTKGPLPGRTTLSAKRAVKGGVPLPATYDGILPIGDGAALDAAPPVSAASSSLPQSALVAPGTRRRSKAPWVVFVGAIGILGVGAALATGRLPGLAAWLGLEPPFAPPSPPQPTPPPSATPTAPSAAPSTPATTAPATPTSATSATPATSGAPAASGAASAAPSSTAAAKPTPVPAPAAKTPTSPGPKAPPPLSAAPTATAPPATESKPAPAPAPAPTFSPETL